MDRGSALPIAIRDLTKTYGAFRALDRVALDIRAGEFLTLLGPSGSGKTTLLMVVAGFIRPDSGSLRFGAREVIRLAPHRRDVGMVFQSYALFPHMDVGRNVGFPLRLRKVPKPEIERRVEAALETVKLAGFARRRVDALSGGQRQRVALARAIVFEPRILVMDEPLSALDKQLREHMQGEIRELHERLGMTTVYVTHDQREALTMSDRVAVIERGRIAQLDTPRGLYERPDNRFVAEFLGESVFLAVTVAEGVCRFVGEPIGLAVPPGTAGPRTLMVRPERLSILAGPEPPGLNVLRGTVTGVTYGGESFVLRAALADGSRVAVRAASTGEALSALPEPGQSVSLAFRPEDGRLLDESRG